MGTSVDPYGNWTETQQEIGICVALPRWNNEGLCDSWSACTDRNNH